MKLTTPLHLARKLGNVAATTPRPYTSIVACFLLKESQTILLVCRPKMGLFCRVTLQIPTAVFMKATVP
jgi:hypothetical protein